MFACICCMLIQSEVQTDFNVLHYLFTILLDKLILDFHATRKWIDINGCLKGSKRYSKIGNSNFICKVHRMIINGFKRAKIPDTEIALCFCCTWKTCSCSRVTSWLWPCSLGRWMAFSTRPESAGKKWSFMRKYWNTKTLKNLREKVHRAHTTCADEQDVIGAVHCLHSVHKQFTELVMNTNSDQEGSLSQWQHIFLKQWEIIGVSNCIISKCNTS